MLPQIEIKDLYNQINKKNTFGIDTYIIPKLEVDPTKIIKDRELQELLKKGGIKNKQKNRIEKKYIDFIMDQSKKVPAPNVYKIEGTIGIPEPKDVKAINFKDTSKLPKKMTFIDQIFKYNKIPAPGVYNTAVSEFHPPTEQEIAKNKITSKRYNERANFLCDIEYLGVKNPGVGEYKLKPTLNPLMRQSIKEIDRKLYKEIEEKGKQLQKSHIIGPSSCHYNPIQLYDTFEKKLQNLQKKEPERQKYHKDLPQQVRFSHYDDKKSKSVSNSTVPGPGMYDLSIKWPDKLAKKDVKDKLKSWAQSITKGVSRSIYY